MMMRARRNPPPPARRLEEQEVAENSSHHPHPSSSSSLASTSSLSTYRMDDEKKQDMDTSSFHRHHHHHREGIRDVSNYTGGEEVEDETDGFTTTTTTTKQAPPSSSYRHYNKASDDYYSSSSLLPSGSAEPESEHKYFNNNHKTRRRRIRRKNREGGVVGQVINDWWSGLLLWLRRPRRRQLLLGLLPSSFPSCLGRHQQHSTNKLIVAVLLWYSLGVVSISTSKLLLTPFHNYHDDNEEDPTHHSKHHHHHSLLLLQSLQHIGGVPPLWLTLQQLLLGSTFLRFLLSIRFMNSPGLHPMETILAMAAAGANGGDHADATILPPQTKKQGNVDGPPAERSELQLLYHVLFGTRQQYIKDSTGNNLTTNAHSHTATTMWYLVQAGLCFAMGFFTTNLAFGTASPTFVETVKAAEPITSAILAVTWKIDSMTRLEVLGLTGIVAGVLLSTWGGTSGSDSTNETSTVAMFMACGIVMTSNLCFSLRGLYQKLFRRVTSSNTTTSTISKATRTRTTTGGTTNNPNDSSAAPDVDTPNNTTNEPNLTMQQQTETPQLDDLNLQFRMQQTGVYLLAIPTLLWEGPSLLYHVLRVAAAFSTPTFLTILGKYFLLSVVNGLAFSSYNLASTYLLTRISVVHHAALNCTRRIFAIVCTSILFIIPITFTSALGITVSFLSFMVFTYAKTTKNSAVGGVAKPKSSSR